jgi:hypothetical protein
MNILNTILITIVLFFTFTGYAKSDSSEAGLLHELEMHSAAQVAGDYDKTLDFTYPPIYKITPKEEILKLAAMMEKSRLAPTIKKFDQKPNLPLKKYSKGVYTVVPYTVEMTINFAEPLNNKDKVADNERMLKDPAELKKFQNSIKIMLKKGMKNSTVIFKNNFIAVIKNSGSSLALNEDDMGWKFVDLSPESLEEIKEVLPQEIRTELKIN